MNKFEVKISYLGIDEKGNAKQQAVVMLVDAVSFGEAEEKAYKKYDGFDLLSVKAIKFSKIYEVSAVEESEDEETSSFFECTVQFVSIDENGKKPKVIKQIILVPALTNDDASIKLKEHLSGMMVDYDVVRVSFSQIKEIVA